MKDKFFYSTENIKTYYIYKWDGVFSGKQGEQCTVEEGPMGQYAIEKFAKNLVKENFDTMPEIKEEDTGSKKCRAENKKDGGAKKISKTQRIPSYAGHNQRVEDRHGFPEKSQRMITDFKKFTQDTFHVLYRKKQRSRLP